MGIVAKRMTPALAEVTGRLAADLPQQAAREMLAERFSVTPSVEAYRRVVADLATQVRTVHDEETVKQLIQWIQEACQRDGKHDVLLQVGRDGVFVQTRPCWEEAVHRRSSDSETRRHLESHLASTNFVASRVTTDNSNIRERISLKLNENRCYSADCTPSTLGYSGTITTIFCM